MKLICILGLTIALVLVHETVPAQEPIDGFYAESRALLAAAGYRPNEVASLISAVYDRDSRIAFRAIFLIALEKPTPGVLAALTFVSASSDETHAVAAFKALQGFPGSHWEDAAVGRLPSMKLPISRLQLSALLAKSGRTEGWPFVKASLTPGHMDVVNAADAAMEFDGLPDETGAPIDALRLVNDVIAKTSDGSPALRFLNGTTQRVQSARQAKEAQRK